VLFRTVGRIDEVVILKWEEVNFQWEEMEFQEKNSAPGLGNAGGGNWESDRLPMNEDLGQVLWSEPLSEGKPTPAPRSFSR